MKVRFDSSKELRPDQDNGLKVLYGPSKRVAYRLRWYLILALVLSPLVYVFGRITLDLLRVEVPAQLQVPSTEIRALESGTIADVGVEVGERVEPGDLLLRLDNPDWRLRLDQLQPASADNPNGLGNSATSLQNSTVRLQGQVVQLFKGLHREGATSSAELLRSEVDLNMQRLALLELERRLRQERFQVEGEPIQNLRDGRERNWLAARLDLLSIRADNPGRVSELLVNKGESVGPGTLLMRVERAEEPLLWIYLRPRDAELARPGGSVEVRMPDDSWLKARILQQADLARLLPRGLRSSVGGEGLASLGADGLALQLPARFEKALPLQWRVDQLPVKVRFPRPWGL
jgi:multidrug resistance efflux pump